MLKSAPQADIQRPKPRITLEPAQVVNMPYKVGEELLSLNHKWAAPLLQQLKTSYVVHPPEKLTPPQVAVNKFSQLGKDNKDNRLEKDVIMQFLNRISINVESGQVFDLKPISNIEIHIKNDKNAKSDEPINPDRKTFLTIPPPLPSLSVTYLHIVLSPISVHGSAITLSNYSGCLFILDKEKKSVVSEAAYFEAPDGQPKFVQSNGVDLYLEVQNLKPSLLLVIILMHSKALNLDNFVEEITSKGPPKDKPSRTPIPFAYSYIALTQSYDNSQAYSFNFPWSLIRSSDDFQAMVQDSSDYDSISLIGKATIQKLPFEKLPRVRLTSDENDNNKDTDVFNKGGASNNSPLLALSIPQREFFPTSIISLSSIKFSFNNPPKGDWAQFRVYLSDSNTDPTKPDSLPVFISRAREPLTTFYESIGMPISRHITFPDIVRMKLDKPLSPTSNIIIQFITADKKGQSIYKLTAFSLFNDNTIIQESSKTFFTHHTKDLKGSPDYLIKCQKSKKSNVSLNIDIPQVFYPPPIFTPLASAQIALEFTPEAQKKIRPENVFPQLIPVVSKLFSLMSKDICAYFIELMSSLRTKESRHQLKSWIFNNFDPSLSKERFFSSFMKSFNEMLNESNYGNVIKSFKIICDILITGFMLKQELDESIYVYLLQVFKNISQLICFKADRENVNEITETNYRFGDLIFIFHSLTDQKIMDAVRFHINNILHLEKPELLFLIWTFLMRFAETNEFPIYIATHFPVKPISRNIISPFNSVSSLIFLSIKKTFESNDQNSIDACCKFLYGLFRPLEQDNVPNKMRYRIAYAFFPILELILSYYENFTTEQQLQLIPPSLFLLGYSPQQLLRYHLIAGTSDLQKVFINFLNLTIDTVIKIGVDKSETRDTLSTIYEELTKRILQIFNFNIRGMKDYLEGAIQVLSKLMNSSYQVPSNYPLLFDTVSRVIHYYPCQKNLVMSILGISISRYHLVRCFSASLVLLFFKSDYDVTNTITQSSVEVLDCLSKLILGLQNADDIEMCKLIMSTISEISKDVFKNDDFTQRLSERTTAANNIANIAEQMLGDKSKKPEERCKYQMKIADQYKAFPSMRSNWLQTIVDINLESNSNSSAFVTQLHICALIATVIMYKSSIDSSIETSEFKKQFNFLVCQPISFGNKLVLSSRLFEFFPSVFEETKMDVSKISKDFKYLALDFTLNYLSESLEKAIKYGNDAKLYYSVRPLYSLQLRIMNELGHYKAMGQICEETSELFHNLKSNGTLTYSNPLKFYVAYNSSINETSIYTIEETNLNSFLEDCANEHISIEQVYEFEEGFKSSYKKKSKTDEFEYQHCWSTFRNRPSLGFLRNKITDARNPEVELIQYKTKNPLPFYIISSEVIDEQKVLISLVDHVRLEMQKIIDIITKVTEQFERLFPCRNSSQIYGDYTIHYKEDIERIVAILQLIFPLKLNNQSESTIDQQVELAPVDKINSPTFYDLMTVLVEKKGEAEASVIADLLKDSIERLMAIFKTVIDNSSEKNYDIYDLAKEHFFKFRNEFNLKDVADFHAYEGKIDPLLEKFDYE